MFGMGFMEIFLIVIVAIIALGPEKLPTAAVDIARFFKKFKESLDDVKTSVDQELHISQMKDEANRFKESVNDIKGISEISLDKITSLDDDVISSKPKEPVVSKINEKDIEKSKVTLEKADENIESKKVDI